MARVGNQEENNQILKNKLESQPVKKFRKVTFKKGCALVFFIWLILFLVLGTAVMAKAGIWQIPILTSLLYKTPQLLRTVDVGDINQFKPEGLKINFSNSENLVVLEVPEKELTYILRKVLTGKKDSPFAPTVQAVISNQEVEFSGLLLKPLSVNLTVAIKPYVRGDSFDYKITKLKVGNLSLPGGGLKAYINFIQSRNMNLAKAKLVQQFGQQVKIKNIKIEEGVITLLAWVDKQSIINNFINIAKTLETK
jgi:hypothetical protein